MHRLSSKSSVYRFRVSALLLCVRFILLSGTLGILIYSVLMSDRDLTLLAIGLGGATLVAVVLQWMFAAKTRCPLCLTPVLSTKRCSKHRKARTFMGSHRLWVALQVLFRGTFVCPYCYECTEVAPRVRSKH